MTSGGRGSVPKTEDEMEHALLEWEYFAPRVAHPEDEQRAVESEISEATALSAVAHIS